jgi:CRISPR-associated protein Csm4
MNLIKVKINPHSSFVTFPKGDTLFGHFVYHSFLEKETIFSDYIKEKKPKIIFSDILPDGYVYKPTLPSNSFVNEDKEDIEWLEKNKKEFKKKSWIDLSELKNGIKICNKKDFTPYKKLDFYRSEIRVRNALNRVSFTTGGEGFDPFSLEEITFIYQPVIYVMFDNTFTKEQIIDRLNRIGKVGFGKKGSIGKGHFRAEIDSEFRGFDEVKSDYYITLSPTLLHKSKDLIEKAYYNTFNRFGKYHSTSTPFKKPLLMADSGAVVKLKSQKQYIGGAIENGINGQSLVQGYSIVVPFEFKGASDD